MPEKATRFAGFAARRDRLRDSLPADVDVLLVSEPRNVRYLTGFTGSSANAIVGVDGAADALVTDARYEQRAAIECQDIRIVVVSDGGRSLVTNLAGQRVGVESHHLSWQAVERLRSELAAESSEIVPLANMVERLRMIKDRDEVERIAAACALTVAAFEWLCSGTLRSGASECDVARQLERRMLDLGADDIAFASIVAAGPNGAIPHHAPTDRRVEKGDLVTVDCGATLDGYHADFTRTIAVGASTAQQREIYDIVEQAQRNGTAAAVPGQRVSDVDASCRSVIASAGHGAAFVHPAGHGIGLAVHEAPIVSAHARGSLEPGIVLTVEPGIYRPEFGGIRIEDTLVVQDGAPKILTESPRELRIL